MYGGFNGSFYQQGGFNGSFYQQLRSRYLPKSVVGHSSRLL